LAADSHFVALFDVDGTLITTDGASPHSRAFKAAFRRVYGSDCVFSVGMHGMTDLQIFMLLAREMKLGDGHPRKLAEDACRCMVEQYRIPDDSDGSYVALAGVKEAIETLRSRGVTLGLVTGNVPEIAADKLVSVGLADYFPFGAFGSEGESRNALPPIAVARAERLIGDKVNPRNVFVIGDTPRDVTCALANGYRAIAVGTGHIPMDDLRKTGADLVLPDLSNIAPILRLMEKPEAPVGR
jgi:phosphoglycolate phosphatase